MEIVNKGWGYEKIICNSKLYCGKILFFYKDKKMSFHYHILKDETFYLESGKIILKYSDNDDLESANTLIMEPGDSFYIYPGLRHQIIALEQSKVYEFSTKDFIEDSYRIVKGD